MKRPRAFIRTSDGLVKVSVLVEFEMFGRRCFCHPADEGPGVVVSDWETGFNFNSWSEETAHQLPGLVSHVLSKFGRANKPKRGTKR